MDVSNELCDQFGAVSDDAMFFRASRPSLKIMVSVELREPDPTPLVRWIRSGREQGVWEFNLGTGDEQVIGG